MSKFLFQLLAALLVWLAQPAVAAEDGHQAEMRSLDEQVQEIKSDVLSIAAELDQLEERLLFPSNTQVTIFLNLGEGEGFRLDAVHLGIDDQQAAHHIYSFKELEALQRGGVQRLFMGNLPGGTHNLEVSVLGKLPNGKDFNRVERFSFDKGIEPALMGITVAPESGRSPISLKDW